MTNLKSTYMDYKHNGWIWRSMAHCSRRLDDLRLILSRQFCGNNWNLDELVKAFKTELENRERCATSSVGISNRTNPVYSSLTKWNGKDKLYLLSQVTSLCAWRLENACFSNKGGVLFVSKNHTLNEIAKHNEMFQMSRSKSSRKRLRTRSHYAGKYWQRPIDNFSWARKHCIVYWH